MRFLEKAVFFKAKGVFYGNPTISAREILVKAEGHAPAIVQEFKKLVASC